MQKIFAQTIDDMRGLINEWSAPSVISRGGAPAVLLAVSGGIDSMCMAELFHSLRQPLPFAVAHCNFRLRSEESDGDEDFVRTWAEERGVSFHHISFDTSGYAAEQGISTEMAARDLRYGWFADLCREYGYKAVAVAHNANDNAETMMLNILRGAGLRGLAGMSEVSDLPCPGAEGIMLLRPLLRCTRKQIEGYALMHRMAYRVDSTNASGIYKRNRIRNEVFPIFAGLNPSFVATLNREMGYFAEAGEIVEDYCRKEAAGVVTSRSGEGISLSIPALMSSAHWKYLLYHILEPYGFNHSVLASVEDLLTSGRTVSGKRFESLTHVLLTERDELIVRVKPVERPETRPFAPELSHDDILPVRGAGTYYFNGSRFCVEVVGWSPDMPLKQEAGTLVMDAGRMKFPFVCRTWRQGDWMIPLGMRGRKKISDLFTDLKYGHKEKEDAVVIVDCAEDMAGRQHVAGILGVRIDDRYKVSRDTVSAIRISLID